MKDAKTVGHIPRSIITIPPSKSLSHRALICGALAGEGSRVINPGLKGEDVTATASCLSRMGLEYQLEKDELQIIKGIGRAGTTDDQSNVNGRDGKSVVTLDCGESGSTMRFLLPLAMLQAAPVNMTGRGRLMQRPLKEYATAIESNGGQIHFDTEVIRLEGHIRAGRFELPGNISSQYISGLLMALPLLDEDSEIILTSELESRPYVDLTLDVMARFGVTAEATGETGYYIKSRQRYVPSTYMVEGDYSAAAFFLVAGALGCDVGCMGLSTKSLQGDAAILQIIERCGGAISTNEKGCIYAKAEKLSSTVIDVRNFPDLVPPIAVLLCFCEGESRIIGAKRLRLKESDRLNSVTTQLNAIGADITEEEDSLIVRGIKEMKGGTVDPHNDHRIAMAAAIASLRSRDKVKILDANCVNKSYPGFWEDFCQLEKSYYAEPVRV